MGAGSTVAAAEALGLCAVGVERHQEYFELKSASYSEAGRFEARS